MKANISKRNDRLNQSFVVKSLHFLLTKMSAPTAEHSSVLQQAINYINSEFGDNIKSLTKARQLSDQIKTTKISLEKQVRFVCVKSMQILGKSVGVGCWQCCHITRLTVTVTVRRRRLPGPAPGRRPPAPAVTQCHTHSRRSLTDSVPVTRQWWLYHMCAGSATLSLAHCGLPYNRRIRCYALPLHCHLCPTRTHPLFRFS